MVERDNSYLIGNRFAAGNKPNKTSFKAGNEPWNKGKKGIRLSPKTEFKKGCESNRKLPIGSITIRQRKNRNEPARAWVKIAEPNVWELRAVNVWKKNNGEIPKGCTIHHIDRNPLNDEIENLQMLSRAEHLAEHRGEHKR